MTCVGGHVRFKLKQRLSSQNPTGQPLPGRLCCLAIQSHAGVTRVVSLEPPQLQQNTSGYPDLTEAELQAPKSSQVDTQPTAADVLSDAFFQTNGPAGKFTKGTPRNGTPLKINQDLLLWRVREQRRAAKRALGEESRRAAAKEVEDCLRRALAADPEDGRGYVALGKLLIENRRFDEARTLFADGCVATGNTNPYLWCSWGYLELVTGNVTRARKLYDAATVVDELHAAAWHGWGLLEKKQGNYLRARDLWMKGIQKCRKQPNAYLYSSLAVMAAELGKTDEARSWFEEGTKTLRGAQSHVLWQAWAVMEASQGEASAVRYLFKKSLQCQPKSRYAHLAWALWERKQRNVRQALQLLERGAQLNPSDPAMFQAWALLEKEAGDVARARILFQRGLDADPHHIPLWQAWGCMEVQQGHFERARELFQQGIWADPTSKDVVYVFQAWGLLEAAQRNWSAARELFKCAVKVDPRSDATWMVWISMEEDLGALDLASELRSIRRAGAYEFQIPPNFTTRPATGLVETLRNWVNVFSQGQADSTTERRTRSLRELLPEDFTEGLSMEDVIIDLEAIKADRSRQEKEEVQRQEQEAAQEQEVLVAVFQQQGGEPDPDK